MSAWERPSTAQRAATGETDGKFALEIRGRTTSAENLSWEIKW